MRPCSGHQQQGLGLFGFIVVVVIAVVALYYAYKGVTGDGEEPSCRGAHADCQKHCRRTRTEAPDLQKCQEACQRDADECVRRGQ